MTLRITKNSVNDPVAWLNAKGVKLDYAPVSSPPENAMHVAWSGVFAYVAFDHVELDRLTASGVLGWWVVPKRDLSRVVEGSLTELRMLQT